MKHTKEVIKDMECTRKKARYKIDKILLPNSFRLFTICCRQQSIICISFSSVVFFFNISHFGPLHNSFMNGLLKDMRRARFQFQSMQNPTQPVTHIVLSFFFSRSLSVCLAHHCSYQNVHLSRCWLIDKMKDYRIYRNSSVATSLSF